MRRPLPLAVLALTVAITPAVRAEEAPLPGLAAYRTGDFEGAVKQFRKAMPKLRSWDRMRAWIYLSASLFALGRTNEAELNVRQLLREFPEAKFDASVFEPGLVALAERVRAEETAKRGRPEDPPKKVVQKPVETSQPPAAPVVTTPPPDAPVVTTPPPAAPVVTSPPPDALVVTPPQPDTPVVAKSSGPLPYIATGGAVAAAGAGVWFLMSSSNQRNDLDKSFDSSGRSTLTYPQAQALDRGASRDMALFAASAATSAALTGVAIWLWTGGEE